MSLNFSAYGLIVESRFDLPVAGSGDELGPVDLTLELAEPDAVKDRWRSADSSPVWHTTFPGNAYVCCQRGHDDDYLISYGRDSFHLCAQRRTLLCAPVDPESLRWQRFLLETALPIVSLLHGFEALHASAIRTPAGVVACVAIGGGGKSALAAELVKRGHPLFADDVLALSLSDGKVLAHPSPPLITLAADDDETAGSLGTALKTFAEDESTWVRLDNGGGDAQPISRVFLMERRGVAPPHILPEVAGPMRLLPHALALDRSPERARARVEILQKLVVGAPASRLQAAGATDPTILADLVEDGLVAAVV